jgi:DNA-binding CsgD family transcriptional regulator
MPVNRRPFIDLLHQSVDLGGFFDAVDRTVARVVPFDAACWLSLDPGTWLPTSHFSREFGVEHVMQLALNEYLEDDVNKFADLARRTPPVGILSVTTGGDLHRSARHARILAPYGYDDGDELRVVFRDGAAVWGCAALHRRVTTFQPEDAVLIASVAGHIVDGIRRAILRNAAVDQRDPDPPGLVILDGEDGVETLTPAAERWLREIFDSSGTAARVPLTVLTVAHRARRADDGQADLATARLPTRSGGWLRLDASLLDGVPTGRVAVIVHAARQPEVTNLIVELYGLSTREREVAGLVLHGQSTREIAEQLHLSGYTVQDHLKAIFAKVGVQSRGQLTAQLFLQQAVPRLQVGAPIGADGWFAAEA